ncbi:ABC transporter substrate-binding protein [Flavobacterium psychrotrophum]|uniref:ABC transporter substrate-binding protein n=1 Tax=Flavobacterium psychrotrophum TaxID=2294119 RepID=UPI000E322F43|nr:ABC transporter substrate-binding protein [Flavobacterium psychrotrophum]
MKKILSLLFVALLAITACKNTTDAPVATVQATTNAIKHAKGLQLYKYKGFSLVKVTQPWPNAKESYTYVMLQKGATLPDSLKQYTVVNVPIKSAVVTSTTHIPSLEILGVENTLVGFPGTQYISSEKTRALIDSGKVKEAGANESLNTEIIIDLNPDAVVAFGINSTNKTLNSLEQAGLKVLYNGDWTEQTPLGKAEWIKFFGALYGMDDKADEIFSKIEKDYHDAQKLAQNIKEKPTVMGGAMLNDQWLLPEGNSWAALFLKDAGANYLWADSKGTGSLSLSFETVLEKAQNADYWIGPSQYTSLKQMMEANPHYAEFKAFKNKKVYSFSTKTGKTGGLIYYELAPNRPDLVLKDLVYIFHPELLPGYKLQFFEQLQ